jgi:SnoaL-like domain
MDSNQATDLITTYIRAWNEGDHERRRHLLDRLLTEEATYEDPRGRVVGPQAMNEWIHAFRIRFPQLTLRLDGPVSHHHARVHYTWETADPEGRTVHQGRDFGHVTPEGRLLSIVTFFGR